MKTKAISCILTAEMLLAPFIGAGAFAQSIPAAPDTANRLATNLADATISIAPQQGFDALSAAISVPTLLGKEALEFQDTGTAQ